MENIVCLIERTGLTDTAIAAHVGVHRSTISRYRTGFLAEDKMGIGTYRALKALADTNSTPKNVGSAA
jgi:transposase